LVCVSGKELRIISLDKLGELFNQTSFPLRYTPRKAVVDPIKNRLVIIEADHNSYGEKEKAEFLEVISFFFFRFFLLLSPQIPPHRLFRR
jgi:splicing factor 3B subunit 3